MATTSNTYTGNGSNRLFSITFPYLNTTDIDVYLNGTLQTVTTQYTFANATTVEFVTAPSNGATVLLRRSTNDTTLAATFFAGSSIRAADLNDNFDQVLYLAQETNNNVANAVAGQIPDGTITNAKINATAGIDASKLSFTQSGTGSVARTIDSKLKDVVSVKDFGAVGDGVTDDTTAIQAALNLGIPIYFPIGIYRTTSELVLKQGSKILGSGCYSGIDTLTVYPTAIDDGTTIIKYDGTAGANVAVVRASSEAVGTEPTNVDTRNLPNVGVSDVVLDGNSKAGIGLYLVRAMMNCQYDRITATNTTEHGFLAMLCFGGSARNWIAFKNQKAGITLGKNVYSWSDAGVDQCHFDSCWAFRSGYNASRTALNQFSEANPDKEYGFGIFIGRALTFTNLQATYNGGAGVYLAPERWPIRFDGSYIEFNSQSSGAANKWGIWFNGVTGNVSRSVRFLDTYFNGPGGAIDGIRLTGIEPSRSGENAVVFDRIVQVSSINADWANYRLVDCDSNVVITGSKPYYIPAVLNGQVNMGISGTAAVAVSGAVITSSVVSGNIGSVTYTGTGDYRVNFTTNMTTNNYLAVVSGNENRSLAIANKGVTGFDVKSKAISAGAFVASDSSTVNIIVIGGYTL